MQNQPPLKLVSCQNIHNETQHFIILLNEEVGTGYFGTVKKAYQQADPYSQLAVKIIPYDGNQQYKQTINKEIDIIRTLGDHPNLVKVLPEKCWSQHNFYIFMQYCNEGTLQTKIKQKLSNKQNFTEPQIFKTFFQLLNGYKVLWQKKILHQDLKPQNILIKDGVHKITDFGFSILHQGVKLKQKRQGTLEYMPLQKLTRANYDASTKSDVYSLGVIFFKMITGRHPYILRAYEDSRDYIDQLKLAVLKPPTYIRARMSMAMQHLFDLIIKMVAKNDNERVDFDEIYSYIEQESQYLSFAQNLKENNKFESQQIYIPSESPNINVKFVEYSTAFAIPFSILKSQEQEYEQLLMTKNVEAQQKKRYQTRIKIEKYLFSMRTMVYFFDRLARRLTVQRERKQFKDIEEEISSHEMPVGQKVIVYLVFLSLKITKQTLNQWRNPSSYSTQNWTMEQWALYKQTRPNVIDLILGDERYLEGDKNEITMREKQQYKIKQMFEIIQEFKKPLIQMMHQHIKPQLQQLLRSRNSMIAMDDKRQLTTLNYILTAIQIIDNFQAKQEHWQELQLFFRQTQTQQIDKLRENVHEGLRKHDFPRSYIEGDWNQEQQKTI